MKRSLKKFSIQQKLFISLALGFVGFLVYFAANFAISKSNQELMNALVEDHLPMLKSAEDLGRSIGTVKSTIVQSAFSGGMDALGSLENAHEQAKGAFAVMRKHDDGRILDLAQIETSYLKTYQDASDILQNLMAGLEQLSAVQKRLQELSTELARLELWAIELKESQHAEFRASVDTANRGSRRSMYAGWALVLCGIPFAIVFYFITRNVTGGLQMVSNRLAEVSQNVLLISSDASASSAKLATGASQQSTAVIETVSSMEQMKSKLAQTVRHSADALRSSEESFREAADGKSVVDSLKHAMVEIERSYVQLEEVNEVVRMIREKTNVINEIVFKTQLLSFNASIEAARAGQHGRGFAVVASEVGKLAEMSGKAAQEIGKLLDHSTTKVAEIVDATKTRVGSANQMSQKCAAVFERITERAGKAKSMVTSISDAANEQESGIHLVGRAMGDMKDSASETDKMAHLISDLSGVLKGHSQALALTVEELDSLVHGSRGRVTQLAEVSASSKPKRSEPKPSSRRSA